jgi:hypothetical protein
MNIHNQRHLTMNGFQCKYCFQKWKKKETMEKHIIMCGFWHKSSQIQEDDYDSTPTVSELYKLVKEFAYKCDKLQQRVDKLENRQNVRQKKQIMEYLIDDPPPTTAIDFVRSFSITQEHLETVFDIDLTAGMKAAIKSNINLQSTKLPIRAFVQKANTLYIYDTSGSEDLGAQKQSQWHIMSNTELDRIISILSLKFLQAFMLWKKTQASLLDSDDSIHTDIDNLRANAVNDQLKQQYQTYMIKINGQRTNEDKRRSEIKQLLYTYLQKQLPAVIEL